MLNNLILFLTTTLSLAEVVTLTKDNFDEFLTKNPKALVKFYAPWCGHCKKLAPIWEDADKRLKGTVAMAEMDLDDAGNADFKTRFDIKGFPTIKYFEDSQPMEYDGGRSSDQIVSWVKKILVEPVIFLHGRDEVNDVKDAFPGEPLLAYEGSLRPGSAEFNNFQQFCQEHHALIQCLAYTGIDGEQPVMELFRPSETSSRTLFDFETTDDEIQSFVLGERLEYFGKLTQDNLVQYIESGLEIIWFIGDQNHYDSVKELAETIAKASRGHFLFAWIDTVSMKTYCDRQFGVTEGPYFAVQAPAGSRGTFFGPKSAELSRKELVDFVNSIKDKTAIKTLKSEEVPEKDEGAVKTLVGSNIVATLENTDEYTILIHAPWCGHCKKFKPDYEKFAAQLKTAGSSIGVFQVDATANDIDVTALQYTGFPTIYYKTSDMSSPVKYIGARDLAVFSKVMRDKMNSHPDGKDEL